MAPNCPIRVQAELKRVYTQLRMYKLKNAYQDNPHISKRKGGGAKKAGGTGDAAGAAARAQSAGGAKGRAGPKGANDAERRRSAGANNAGGAQQLGGSPKVRRKELWGEGAETPDRLGILDF